MSTLLPLPGARSTSSDAPAADVVDITAARHARETRSADWYCSACDLVAEGFTPTECAYLAAVHDQVQHGSRPTARVIAANATPVPPADVEAGFGIGA